MTATVPTLSETCTPREDVLQGELVEDQFAADLSDVAFDAENTPDIYADPSKFFENTYPTDGLKELLTLLTKRYVGDVGDVFSGTNGVLSLDTQFGGGKTHNQIAAYHFSTAAEEIEEISKYIDDSSAAEAYSDLVTNGFEINTAVFVGDDVSAQSARMDYNDPNAPETRTMWGEIAYQLGGAEGYEEFKEHDHNRDPPGENELSAFFDSLNQPSLILIDEIADYFNRAGGFYVENTDKTLDTLTNSFLMSLLKATKNTDQVTVVLSVATSAFEDQAETVRETIDDFDAISERTQKRVEPTEDDEVAAVLRYRLFDDVNLDAGEEVTNSYMKFYNEHSEQLPDTISSPDTRESLVHNYPFHPTLIDTLMEEIDSIHTFQRTRGGLKILSRAIYKIWSEDRTASERHYIRLMDLHPKDSTIRAQLHSLFDPLDIDLRAAIRSDIHAEQGKSQAQLEDENWIPDDPPVASQLAVTILWKSIVKSGTQGRGVSRSQLRYMIYSPDIDPSHYEDALTRMLGNSDSPGATVCFHLYDDQRGLRFRRPPKIEKLIYREKQEVEDGVARNRLRRMLEGQLGTGSFNVIHDPAGPHEVPDEVDIINLCVIGFSTAVIEEGNPDPPHIVEELAENVASSRGGSTSPRIYQNNMLFLVADEAELDDALDNAKELVAIQDRLLTDNGETYDLNSEQIDRLQRMRDTQSSNLGQAVRQVYRHLFYQTEDGLDHSTVSSVTTSEASNLHEMAYSTLEDLGLLLTEEEERGEAWFREYIWNKGETSMTTAEIKAQFGKRTQVELLLSDTPVRQMVAYLVDERGFAYWDEQTDKGRYTEGESTKLDEYDDLSGIEELQAGLDMNEVTISDDEYIYENVTSLINDRGPLTVPTSGTDGGGEDDEDDEEERETGPDSINQDLSAATEQPRSIGSAFASVEDDIDTDVQQVKNQFSLHDDELNIDVAIDSITIQLVGGAVWEETYQLCRVLAGEIGGLFEEEDSSIAIESIKAASSLDFDYVATMSEGNEYSTTYEGPIGPFLAHLSIANAPTDIHQPDGEATGTATITIDVSQLSSQTPEEVLSPIGEAFENLRGIGGIDLRVEGTVSAIPEVSA